MRIKVISSFLFIVFLFCNAIALGQVTNIKAGLWNDPAVWSNNSIPDSNIDVILNYDITVNVNAYCRSLMADGHTVIINSGFNLDITGRILQPSDTATLAHILNTYYSDSAVYDSTVRILKNSYVNGIKRISMTVIDFSTDSGEITVDTSYANFNYDKQNRLIDVHWYDTDPADGWEDDSIIWKNNNIANITVDTSGTQVMNYSYQYTASGKDTNIAYTIYPSQSQDTVYTDNTDTAIFQIQDSKLFVTVDTSFTPVSQTTYDYNYYANYEPDGNSFEYDHDTLTDIYTYSNHNLNSDILYITATNVNTDSNPSVYYNTDTSSNIYHRHLSESPAVNQLLLNVYGNKLLTTMNFFDAYLSTDDLLGDPGDIESDNSDDYDYDVQTIDSTIYSYTGTTNGVSIGSSSYTNYKAANSLDSKNRLKQSNIYESDNVTVGRTLRIIYPD